MGLRITVNNFNSFHEKAGNSQGGFIFTYRAPLPLSQAASDAILPSGLFVSDDRSVQVGRTRFSRCCYLSIDPFSPKDAQRFNAACLGSTCELINVSTAAVSAAVRRVTVACKPPAGDQPKLRTFHESFGSARESIPGISLTLKISIVRRVSV